MNPVAQSVLVGLVAGLASSLLLLGSGGSPLLAVALWTGATLPVLIAGLGWSNTAGLVSIGSAFVFSALVVAPGAGAMIAIALAPAAWIAHLSNLARPAEELGGPAGQMAWFPIADIMLHLCGLIALVVILSLTVVGYSEELIGQLLDSMNAAFREQAAVPFVTPDDRAAAIATLYRIIPALTALMWVQLLFLGWYVASAIIRMSGRAKRPADDIPASLRMPRLAILALAAGLLMSLATGAIGLIGLVVSGAFGGGFVLSGLAVIHDRTRGRPWRPFALWAIYVSIFVFTIPLLLFLILGLMDTARTSPLTKSTDDPTNNPDD